MAESPADTYYVGVRKQIASFWPHDLLTLPDLYALESVWIAPSTLEADEQRQKLTFETTLLFEQALRFDLGFVTGVSLVLGNADLSTPVHLLATFSDVLDPQPGTYQIQIGPLPITLLVAGDLLTPMQASGDGFVEAEPDPVTGESRPLEIKLEGASLTFDSRGELSFAFADGAPVITPPPFMIGETGIIVEVSGFSLILSEAAAQLLPQTIPADSRGVYIEHAKVYLPEGLEGILPDDATSEALFIGSGGFCGKVTGDWTEEIDAADPFAENAGSVFGFRFRLGSVGIEFNQNALVSGSIAGYLQVPFFDAALEVDISITHDGDFTVSLGSDTGLLTLEKSGVISIAVSSLEFANVDGEYSVTLTGSVTPLLAGFDWPSFQLNGLTISSDGTVKVEGAWITLPQLKTLDFHGFKIEISQLGFGAEEDNGARYNWIGFSGGIQIVSGLPLRGGVEGLKLMWSLANDPPRVEIGGVALGFEIEKVLTFDGKAYFIDEEDPEDSNNRIRGFKGGMKVGLIPLNGAGFDAQFIAGDNGEYKFFYLFIDVALPVGIPVLPPTLGLYGIAGLFAYNMTLDYPALVEYENEASRPNMTDVGSWINQEGALAFGAGVTVGTLADNGFTAKAKVVFAIMIPGPIILIEGFAKILSYENAYPFRVLAVLDVPSGTFLMNIGVTFAFPKDSGDLLDVTGSAEALIPAGDLSGWHLYLGRDQPESKRLRANVFGFFTAQTYFMVDQEGLSLGVWIGYSLDERYGVLRVILESWISSALTVSWMPLQALGTFTWLGRAELSVAKIGLGISVEATATVEVPKPLSIAGALTVQLKTPIGKPKATIKIKWEKPGTPPFPLPLASILGIEHRKVSESWEVAKSSEYGVDADRLWNGLSGITISIEESELPVVPPDVMLILNFDKPVRDIGLIGGNNPDLPSIESSGAYEFTYELLTVALDHCASWSSSPHTLPWVPFEDAGSDYALTGSWQVVPDADGLKNTKLVINAISSLEISRLLEDNSSWLQLLSLYNPSYPCLDPPQVGWTTLNFESYALDQILYPMFVEAEWVFLAGFPMRIRSYAAPWLETTRSLGTEAELERFRCLLILEVARTAPQNQLSTNGLEIHAATHPQAFVQYREEASAYLDYGPRTELYVNRSSRDPALGLAPARIRFPQPTFSSWPDKVWLTLMVDVLPDTLMIARDGAGNEVDRIDAFSDCSLNPHTYLLKSSKGNPIREIELIGRDFQIKEICWNEYEYALTSRVWVHLPELMAKLELDLGKGSAGRVYFLDSQQGELETVVFNVVDDGTDKAAAPVVLNVDSLPIKLILIEGSFELLQIRGLTRAASDVLNDYDQRRSHIRTAIEENWGKHTAQLLLPNMYYRVSVRTASKRRKKTNSTWTPANFTEYMYFKTGDPPGTHTAAVEPNSSELEPAAGSEHYPDRGPLTDLSAYIAANIPTGAPANERQVLHYRSYDVGVVFNDSYIEQMYQAAGFGLGLKLLDNNLRPVTDANGQDIFLNGWADNPTLSVTREETQYSTLWNETNCLGISTAVSESNQELLASSPSLQLSPRTQYKAQVWAGNQHAIYEFHFSSSRYACFLHQIHDFKDAAWNHMAVLDDPEFEIDPAALNACLQNVSDIEEYVQFEQLMNVFGLNPRTSPQQLEVSLLNDRQQSYGLLLETPEPLAAERVRDIGLARTEFAETVEEFDHSVKLIRASVSRIDSARTGNEGPDYNGQWLEVLLLEAADLSAYRVDYRDNASSDEDAFVPYFTFAPGSVYPAGTKLIIYNGSKPEAETATEHVQLYAGHVAQSFVPRGTHVRLFDALDRIVHQRRFFRDSAYSAQDCHVIRNQDQTRLFFFAPDNGLEYSALRSGVYRIAFTFLRVLGDGGPVLKRFGYDDPEQGHIEFSLPAALPGLNR